MEDLRTFVTFEADFPDDAEWNESPHLVVPGGRNVASAIRERLEGEGLTCSIPEQHSFYGWSFDVERGSTHVWLLLQFPGPWLLIAVARRSVLKRLLGRRRIDEESAFLSQLHNVLTCDKRFRSVRWYTRREYERGESEAGHSAP